MEAKEQILDGAQDLFMRIGIKSVSMDDIARNLGISKKTIYKFFENKKDLVCQIFDGHLEDEKIACQKFFHENENAIQQMIDMSHYISKSHQNLTPSVLYDIQKYYPRQWKNFEEFSRGYVADMVKQNLSAGVKEGLYRKEIDVEIVTHLYIDLMNGMMVRFSKDQSNPNFKIIHLQMVTYHLRGICTPKGLTYLEKHINEI